MHGTQVLGDRQWGVSSLDTAEASVLCQWVGGSGGEAADGQGQGGGSDTGVCPETC